MTNKGRKTVTILRMEMMMQKMKIRKHPMMMKMVLQTSPMTNRRREAIQMKVKPA